MGRGNGEAAAHAAQAHARAKISTALFSPDGTRILTASDDRSARLWDAATGEQTADPLWHKRAVVRAIFSPDGNRVLTASLDGTAQPWDTATGRPLTPPLQHRDAVRDIAFSPDGTRIATASQDRTARLWDAATGWLLGEFTHDDCVQTAAFSPDGTRLLTASLDGTARIWEAGPAGAAPAWFIEMAEQLCGWKFGESDTPERVTRQPVAKEKFANDEWSRLAKRLME